MLAVIPYPGLELLSTAVLMLDEELNVTYANPAAETLFAAGRRHLIGAPIDRALPVGAPFVERLRQAMETEAGFNENDMVLDLNGEPIHVHCVVSPFEGAHVAPADAPGGPRAEPRRGRTWRSPAPWPRASSRSSESP